MTSKEDLQYAMDIVDGLDEDTSTVSEYSEAVSELYNIIRVQYFMDHFTQELFTQFFTGLSEDLKNELLESAEQYRTKNSLTAGNEERLEEFERLLSAWRNK